MSKIPTEAVRKWNCRPLSQRMLLSIIINLPFFAVMDWALWMPSWIHFPASLAAMCGHVMQCSVLNKKILVEEFSALSLGLYSSPLFYCLKPNRNCSGVIIMELMTMSLGMAWENDGKNLGFSHVDKSHTHCYMREKCTSAQLLWLAKLLYNKYIYGTLKFKVMAIPRDTQ